MYLVIDECLFLFELFTIISRLSSEFFTTTTTNYFFLILYSLCCDENSQGGNYLHFIIVISPLSLYVIFIISHIEITIYYSAETFALYFFFCFCICSHQFLLSLFLLLSLIERYGAKGGGRVCIELSLSLFVDCSTTTAVFLPSYSSERDDVGREGAKVGRL
jgi:hypothetical protein